jgi:GxxExxY protein
LSKLILATEVYSVVNAALEVLKKLGHGFHEKPYENALVVELSSRGISCQQQKSFNVVYKGTKVGEYIPGLIADGAIIIDPKVIDKISDHERGRMINYLRITGLPVGLIINFRRAKLEWERIILTEIKPRIDANIQIYTNNCFLFRVHSRFNFVSVHHREPEAEPRRIN